MSFNNPPASKVGVVADPGLCTRVLERVMHETDAGRSEGNYELEYDKQRIPLLQDGTLDFDQIRRDSHRNDDEYLVIITEVPRREGKRPKITALHFEDGIAIISLPALGWSNLNNKLHRVLFDSIDALLAGQEPDVSNWRMKYGQVHRLQSTSGDAVLVDWPWWRPRRTTLVLGMVRSNGPLKTAGKLSSVWAAAIGTGAFGIFYSSIWQMADFLPTWRLGVIILFAIMAMVSWLILSNGLWEKMSKVGSLTEAAMYNASAIVSLALSVILLYLALFSGIAFAAMTVIDAGFMSQVLERPASWANYLEIAWFSASMGTVAGALGSNFDNTEDIRELTQGQRNAHRYQRN